MKRLLNLVVENSAEDSHFCIYGKNLGRSKITTSRSKATGLVVVSSEQKKEGLFSTVL
jgi:hypothetical protein